MQKLVFAVALVLCFLLAASAQTPNFKYEFTKFGAPFPNASSKRADTASVAADGKGLIFVLRRSDPPVLVYNREGKLVNSKFIEEWEPLHLTTGSVSPWTTTIRSTSAIPTVIN